MKEQVLDVVASRQREVRVLRVGDHAVEIVSDSGEGAQTCGQIFGSVSAKMGNGSFAARVSARKFSTLRSLAVSGV